MLALAVVFAVAMAALSSGGWWWAWLAGIVLLFGGRLRLPLLGGIKLDAVTRFIVRENARTRRNNRRTRREERQRIRNQRRATRTRRRQTQ